VPGFIKAVTLDDKTGKQRTKSFAPVMRCRKIAVAAVMTRAKFVPILRAIALSWVTLECCR